MPNLFKESKIIDLSSLIGCSRKVRAAKGKSLIIFYFPCSSYLMLLVACLFWAGVSNELGLEEVEVCGMHGRDRLCQSAVGALVRTKKKVHVYPFLEEQALMKKAHALVVHFSYNKSYKDL